MSTIGSSRNTTVKPTKAPGRPPKPSRPAANKPKPAAPKDSASVSRPGKPNADTSGLRSGLAKNFPSVASVPVAKGATLNGIATSQLKQAGFENPTPSQVKKAAGELASVNQLRNPNNIQAGRSLQEPLSQTEGKVFNQLSQFPSGKADPKTWTSVVEGQGGLGDITRARQVGGGDAAVDSLSSDFNSHMQNIGRPEVTMDTAQSRAVPTIRDFEIRDAGADRRFISGFNSDPASLNP